LVAIKFVSQQDYDEAAATFATNRRRRRGGDRWWKPARQNLGYTKVTAADTPIGKSTVTTRRAGSPHQATRLATIQHLYPIYIDVTQLT